MILLYGKSFVKKELTIQMFLDRLFTWVKGMKDIPDDFRQIELQQDEMWALRKSNSSVEYAINWQNTTVAFCLKLEDELGELWRTDLVLQEGKEQGIMQIRLAKEQKKATVDVNQSFRLPWVLRKLFRDGYGGIDNGIPVFDKPYYVDENNIEEGQRCINHTEQFEMPVVYVSKEFCSNDYQLKVEELAIDLAGIAHVIAEKDISISKKMKDLTGGKNPYNGAIGIYYQTGEYVRFRKSDETNCNQFRYKIAKNIYRRMSMLNIPGEQSLSEIRTNILLSRVHNDNKLDERETKIQELQIKLEQKIQECEDARQELDEYIETFGKADEQVHILESKLQYYESVFANNYSSTASVSLQYTEKDFYPNEVKDVLLEVLQRKLKEIGEDEQKRRSYHVIKNVLDNNNITDYRGQLIERISNIIEKNKSIDKACTELTREGFKVKGNDHKKIYYQNDGRYMCTLACTPSDCLTTKNTLHDTIDILFK